MCINKNKKLIDRYYKIKLFEDFINLELNKLNLFCNRNLQLELIN